jgi:gluconolactonase
MGDHIVPAEPYGTFYAGSWPINNRVMYEGLEYSGYDVKLEMGTEAHNMKQGGAIMPDALRWLWRGYPERAKVYAMVSADKSWEQVGGSYGDVVGPTGDEAGDVFFADTKADRIYKADGEGKVSILKERAGGVRALRDGPGSVLYAYQAEHHQIVAYAPGSEQRVVARGVDVTDMAVTIKSGIYFTDAVHKTIGYVDGTGKVHVVHQGGEIAVPTGIALSGD